MTAAFRLVGRLAVTTAVVLGTLSFVRSAVPVASAAAPFHLRLVKSEPSKGDTVASPTVLRLWFSETATLSVTSIKLKGSDETDVALGKPTFSGDVTQPVTATIGAPLKAGTYTLSFKTASKDMHPITGDFSFVVK